MGEVTISHALVKVRNIRSSASFYGKLCGILGLKQIRKTATSLAYANGSFSLWLRETDSKGDPQPEAAGINHIAFRTDSKGLVDEIQLMLEKEKFQILYPAEEHPEFAPGYYSVSFLDPDGTILEVLYLPKSRYAYG